MSTTSTFDLRPVDPAADAALIHGWVSKDRAAFWGMEECTVERVREIYAWIQEQEHLEAFVVSVDGHPVGLMQTYDPLVDEIGDFYERREGDLGAHLLLDDDPQRAGQTPALVRFLLDRLLERDGVERLVLEPDARNAKSLALAERLGFERGPRVHLKTSVFDKPAQFFFLTRSRPQALPE